MRNTLLTSVSVAALACSALATADAAPVYNWTGFYIGGNAGYAWGISDPVLIGSFGSPPLFTQAVGTPAGLRPQGFAGGGQAGYNWQIGNWLLGLEADFDALHVNADASVSPFFIGKNSVGSGTWSAGYDWLFTAGPRAGLLVVPNWLLYGTGGYAVTRLHDSATCISPGGACTSSVNGPSTVLWSETKTRVGPFVGGGVEAMFLPHWTARVQYIYAKFDDTTPNATSATAINQSIPPSDFPALFSFHHNLSLVTFAISYNFGGLP